MLSRRVTMTVSGLAARAYEMYRDEVALISGDGTTMTYGQLGSAARSVAGGLAELGLHAGDRAVVCLRNRPEYLIVDHALLSGGYVRVPVSYRLHVREVVEIVADSGAKALFVEADRAEETAGLLAAAGLDCRAVAVGEEENRAELGLSSLLAAPERPLVPRDPEDLVWLPYTSGTTGEPKGVMVHHRGLMATIRNLMVELPPISERDVVLHVGPLSHLSGYLAHTYMMRGAAQMTLAEFDARTALTLIEENKVTVMPAVPTMITMLLAEAESGEYELSSLHTVPYGGSAIAPDRLVRAVKAFGNVFIQAYGLTEVPFPLASLSKESHEFDPDTPPPARLASAGRITPFIDLKLVDDDGVEVPPGQVGEIWARGDQLMAGYWNRSEETERVVHRGGWVSTGDLAKIVEGYLHIVDRKKDMIVSGGFNVFPSEVERIISAIPGVREVAVVGSPDPRWGEAVTAVVSLVNGAQLTAEQVIDACGESIAGYKKPKRVVFVEDLPKSGTGKILRRVIRDDFWKGQERLVGG